MGYRQCETFRAQKGELRRLLVYISALCQSVPRCAILQGLWLGRSYVSRHHNVMHILLERSPKNRPPHGCIYLSGRFTGAYKTYVDRHWHIS